METILVYVVIVVAFVGVPWVIDILMAYMSQNKIRKLLVDKAFKDGLSPAELKELLKESRKAPGGIQGLYRASMALSVILILGIAVFHLLVKGAPGDSSQIISNILSMLGGLLAAITGFYFGGRAVEKKKEES